MYVCQERSYQYHLHYGVRFMEVYKILSDSSIHIYRYYEKKRETPPASDNIEKDLPYILFSLPFHFLMTILNSFMPTVPTFSLFCLLSFLSLIFLCACYPSIYFLFLPFIFLFPVYFLSPISSFIILRVCCPSSLVHI